MIPGRRFWKTSSHAQVKTRDRLKEFYVCGSLHHTRKTWDRLTKGRQDIKRAVTHGMGAVSKLTSGLMKTTLSLTHTASWSKPRRMGRLVHFIYTSIRYFQLLVVLKISRRKTKITNICPFKKKMRARSKIQCLEKRF